MHYDGIAQKVSVASCFPVPLPSSKPQPPAVVLANCGVPANSNLSGSLSTVNMERISADAYRNTLAFAVVQCVASSAVLSSAHQGVAAGTQAGQLQCQQQACMAFAEAGSSTSTPTPLQSLRDAGHSFTIANSIGNAIMPDAGLQGGYNSAGGMMQHLDDSNSPLSSNSSVVIGGVLTPCGGETVSAAHVGCKRSYELTADRPQQQQMVYQQNQHMQQALARTLQQAKVQQQAAALAQQQQQQQLASQQQAKQHALLLIRQRQAQQQQQAQRQAQQQQQAQLQVQQLGQQHLQALLASQRKVVYDAVKAAAASKASTYQVVGYTAAAAASQQQQQQQPLMPQGSGTSTASSYSSGGGASTSVWQQLVQQQEQKRLLGAAAAAAAGALAQQQQQPLLGSASSITTTSSSSSTSMLNHLQKQRNVQQQHCQQQQQCQQPPAKRAATQAAVAALLSATAASQAKQQQLLPAMTRSSSSSLVASGAAAGAAAPYRSVSDVSHNRLLAWAGQVLSCQLQDAYLLAVHIFKRVAGRLDDMLLISLGVTMPVDSVTMLVSLWVATKLEGHRRQVAGCSKLAAALQLLPWAVTSVELHMMQLLGWQPYVGWAMRPQGPSCVVTEY